MVRAYNVLTEPEERSVESSEIHIITTEDYQTRKQEYVKEMIYFYESDSVFSHITDDKIDDPTELFGANIHLQFGSQTTDPDVVYVRNDKMQVDYEIIRMHDSYSSAVLGIVPEEKPKRKNSRKRVQKVEEEFDNDTSDDEDDA